MKDQGEVDARAIKVAAHERLGQHAEAEAEAAEILKIDPGFSLSAYAKSQPYKDRAVLDGILSELRKAGLPE